MSNRHKHIETHESTHVNANVNFFNTTINDSNVIMTSNYQKYANGRLNHSVGGADQKNVFQYLMDDHRRTGKILLGGLNIICPNETCWSQMHKMILSRRQVFFTIP